MAVTNSSLKLTSTNKRKSQQTLTKTPRSAIGAPAQPNQSSRKGKRAWRKNVNIEDVEEGLEGMRVEERVTGLVFCILSPIAYAYMQVIKDGIAENERRRTISNRPKRRRQEWVPFHVEHVKNPLTSVFDLSSPLTSPALFKSSTNINKDSLSTICCARRLFSSFVFLKSTQTKNSTESRRDIPLVTNWQASTHGAIHDYRRSNVVWCRECDNRAERSREREWKIRPMG